VASPFNVMVWTAPARAIAVGHDGSKRCRIVFVQHATDPEKSRVLEVPNPASEKDKSLFRIVGRSSVRMAFGWPDPRMVSGPQ
jgi:hypothetical protein